MQKLATAIKAKLGFLPQDIKVTLIEEKDKYGALTASDFGLLHNGEATVEAAGAQLPSLVVDNMTNVHSYFNNLYNGHASPLNIATNYEGYQDLCGSLTAIPDKIGTLLLRHF
jgi:lipid A disaccharide synthetase